MAVFPLLVDAENYRACATDLLNDHEARSYWLEVFGSQIEVGLEAAATRGFGQGAIDGVRRDFLAEIDLIREQPDRHGRLDILLMDEIRQGCLDRHGIEDEFRLVKERENAYALGLLPEHLERVDKLAEGARFEMMTRSILAGNLFDMGAQSVSDDYDEASLPFAEALDRVPARPWLGDDLDAMREDWLLRRPQQVVLFVDNAGADMGLGILPLVREMLRGGSEVVLAANEGPSWNDVTAREIREKFLPEAIRIDSIFGSRQLTVVGNGHQAPLLNLLRVSGELAEAVRDFDESDLVVLVGMGRSIESNRTARFICPCWKIGMVKDPQVARGVGGKVFDAIVRREPGSLPE